MDIVISVRRVAGAAAVAILVLASGQASAQSPQRSTDQPLGAVAVKPRENGPTSPLTAGPATTVPATPATTVPTTPGTKSTAQRFSSEVDARTACGSQPVVWVNTRSKKFFAPGMRPYGKTRHGTYMCRDMASTEGFRPAKS